MPQMAPMNWLMLFFMFIISFMIFNSMNYFAFLYLPKTMFLLKKKSLVIWKW